MTYTLTLSKTIINEGEETTLEITNPFGFDVNEIYFEYDGSEDLQEYIISVIGVSGLTAYDYTFTTREDESTEGDELVNVYLYSDSENKNLLGKTSFKIIDTSMYDSYYTDDPTTYTLTLSKSIINEGEETTLEITNPFGFDVDELYFKYDGEGSRDLTSKIISVTGVRGLTSYDFTFTTSGEDESTEGEELANVYVYSDNENKNLLGKTSIKIIDTSTGDRYYFEEPIRDHTLPGAENDYWVAPQENGYSPSAVNEGIQFTTYVGVNISPVVPDGTTVYWDLIGTGIDESDFSSGALSGSGTFVVDPRFPGTGLFSLSHTTSNDLITEGTETFNIRLFYDSARTIEVASSPTVTIYDTSSLTTSATIINYSSTIGVTEVLASLLGPTQSGAYQTDITDTSLTINASSWTGSIEVNFAAKASAQGERLDAKQIDFASSSPTGSILQGDDGDDQLWGKAGWDVFDSGKGNDLIRAGNGRDILTGGSGADELHGDFGWNTYQSEKDGFSDLIAIKSDQHLSNWLYGKAGNNANGEKADIIEGLDANDQIIIIGVFSPDITVSAGATAHGVSGIGIYAKGALEALYTGGELSVAQLTAMTSGDGSAAAMANEISSYGWTGV